VQEQESLTADERVRPAAEDLFLTLLGNDEQVTEGADGSTDASHRLLAPLVVQMITSMQPLLVADPAGPHGRGVRRAAPMTLDEVVRMDALLLAAGIGAYEIRESGLLDMNQWAMAFILPTLQALATDGRPEAGAGASDAGWAAASTILRRRLLWLLQCCVFDLADASRGPLMFEVVAILRDSSAASDLGVRLTAVAALQAFADASASDAAVAPLLGDQLAPGCYSMVPLMHAVEGLYATFAALDSTEAREQVMALLETLVDRFNIEIITASASASPAPSPLGNLDVSLGSPTRPPAISTGAPAGSASPVVNALLAPLPGIWIGCGEQNLLRSSILKLVAGLVVGLGARCEALCPLAMPMLLQSTNPASAEAVYLLGEGLELLGSIVDHSPRYTPEMHQLFPHVASAMGVHLDAGGTAGAAEAGAADLEHLSVAMTLSQSYALLGAASAGAGVAGSPAGGGGVAALVGSPRAPGAVAEAGGGQNVWLQAHAGLVHQMLQQLIGQLRPKVCQLC
jgi:hypothetical protein